MARILVADDEEGIRSFLAEALEMFGHSVQMAENGQRAIQALDAESFDVVFTDLKMPGTDGMEVLSNAARIQPEAQVIVMTAHGTVENAVDAMKLGAFDYLEKPVSGLDELRLLVERAIERKRLLNLQDRTERADDSLPPLTYGDPAMRPAVEALEKVARTAASVLLLGESGTGKEIAARALHRWSARSSGPFMAINCAALSEELLASELFGHERGAFTGAVNQRRGRIELAEGGTFFLDEVGELKPELQAKLLRVLETRKFERVGGNRTIEANVRWVAATHRNLGEMVSQGTFREDLYHRLAVFPIQLPALRERRRDLIPLAESLLIRIAADIARPDLELSDGARAYLQQQTWPGNVRELRNALERAAILADGTTIEAEQFTFATAGAVLPAPSASSAAPAHAASTKSHAQSLADIEKDAIIRTLAAVKGNRRQAAEQLGIGLRTLYDKLKRYEIS